MLSHTIHTYYDLLANLNKIFFHYEIFDRSLCIKTLFCIFNQILLLIQNRLILNATLELPTRNND